MLFLSHFGRWPWPAVGLTALLSVASCAALPPVPVESTRTNWGNMVVAPARYPPKSNFEVFAVGQKAGVTKGAASGAAAALFTTGAYASAGALEALVAPYLLVVGLPAAVVGGAIYGGHAAISEQDAAALQAHIQESLTTLQVSATLARAMVDMAQRDANQPLPLLADAGPGAPDSPPDLRALERQGANSAMEVVVTRIGFTGGKRLRFYMVATVRILAVHDGSTMYQREFVYQSDEYAADKWGANQAALMGAELQRAYGSLANSAVEQIFLLTSLPLQSRAESDNEPHGFDLFGGRYEACGIAWASPPHAFYPAFTGDPEHRNWNRFIKVSSVEPTLAWEAFPRNEDHHSANMNLANISNVRYDLRVWKVIADAPPLLVDQKRDLTSTSYKLQSQLEPDSRYFWSVRARFNLDGRVRGTKWGSFRIPAYPTGGSASSVRPEPSLGAVIGPFLAGVAPRDPCTLDFIPTANYYRFETP